MEKKSNTVSPPKSIHSKAGSRNEKSFKPNNSQDWSKSHIDEYVMKHNKNHDDTRAIENLNSGFEEKLRRMATSRSSERSQFIQSQTDDVLKIV